MSWCKPSLEYHKLMAPFFCLQIRGQGNGVSVVMAQTGHHPWRIPPAVIGFCLTVTLLRCHACTLNAETSFHFWLNVPGFAWSLMKDC